MTTATQPTRQEYESITFRTTPSRKEYETALKSSRQEYEKSTAQSKQRPQERPEFISGPFDVWAAPPDSQIWKSPGADFVRGFGAGWVKQTQVPALMGKKLPPPATIAEKIGEGAGRMMEVITELIGLGAAMRGVGLLSKTIPKGAWAGRALQTGGLFATHQITEEARKATAEAIYDEDFGSRGGIAVLESFALGAALSLVGSGIGKVWSKLKPAEQAQALRTLGLKKGASLYEINKASRKYALKFHPDKVKGMRIQFEKVIKARNALRRAKAGDVIIANAKQNFKKQLMAKVGITEDVADIAIQRLDAGESVTKVDQMLSQAKFGIKPLVTAPTIPELAPTKPVAPITKPEAVRVGEDVATSMIGAKGRSGEGFRLKDVREGRGRDITIVAVRKGEPTRGGSETVQVEWSDGHKEGFNAGRQSDGSFLPVDEAIQGRSAAIKLLKEQKPAALITKPKGIVTAKYDKASIQSATEAVKRTNPNEDRYIYATAEGFIIDKNPPLDKNQSYRVVHPDYSYEDVQPFAEGEEARIASRRKVLQERVKRGEPTPEPLLREFKDEKWAQEALAKPEGKVLTVVPKDKIEYVYGDVIDSTKTEKNLPSVPEGHIRLYRGQHPTEQKDLFHPKRGVLTDKEIKELGLSQGKGGWFTPWLNYALKYAEAQGEGGEIAYIDMPIEEANKYRREEAPSGLAEKGEAMEYFIPELRTPTVKPEAAGVVAEIEKTLKPMPRINKFLPKDDRKIITKEGDYTNGRWLIKKEFVPARLKEKIDADTDEKIKPPSKDIYPEDPGSLSQGIVGVSKPDAFVPIYVLRNTKGVEFGINKYYYDYLNKYISDFGLRFFAPDRPATIYSGKKVAGIIMPVNLGTKKDYIYLAKTVEAQPPTEAKAEVGKVVRPKGKPGFVDVRPLLKVHKTFMNIVEPSKVVEIKLGKEPYAAVIKGIHQTDVGRIEFNEAQIEGQDKSLSQLSQWFSKFTDKDLKNFMASRGEPTTESARTIQEEARGKLPKELRRSDLFSAVQRIADQNYKYLQSVVGDDINRVEDYFYGIYKNPKKVDKFLDYWRTTKRFTKEKKLPTVADALDYGLELRNYNPIENLKAEYIAISHLEGMNWMRDELLRTGKGKFIDSVEDAPLEWDKVQDPVFRELRLQPDLAKLINNLIATNKITRIPIANTLREINNVARTIKFVGSAFHLLSVAKQSIADSGYLGFLYKPTATRGFTGGFRANDPIFRTTAYKDYIRHGGGHRYSVESEARRTFNRAVNELNRNMGIAVKVGALPLKIPTGFVNWMFQSYIPKVKYSKFLDVVAEQEKKRGRKLTSPEKIDIIKEQQNFYGMMNERLFGRSGTVTSALRFYFMSPGYAEGNYRTMLKAAMQWGGKSGTKANRSRSNIINSWLITGMAATVGTLAFTGKLPKKPETLEDARDLFKIDTGKKDEKGRRIMIDLMTFDRDYWNVAFNLLRLRPDVAFGKSWKRIGGMKSPTAEIILDLVQMSMGKAIYDWKGDRVVEITDPFLLKAMKLTTHEIEKLVPISVSVFQQSKKRDIDTTIAAIETLLGFRPTKTEKDLREQKIISKMYSLAGQREEMSYYIGQSTDPKRTVEIYNKTVNDILNSPYVPKPMKDEWSQKLLVDYESVVTWKRFPAGKMTDAELSRAYDAHTLSVPYKRRGEPFRAIGEPKKGSERRVGELKAEAKKRGIELKRGPRKPPRR